MNTQKKISFSFSKSSKATSLLATKRKEEKSDVELIECLEGQSIKVKNPIEKADTPLVIPLRDDSKDLLDRIRQSQQIKSNIEDKREADNRPDSELTLDELAARQLLREATQKTVVQAETKIHAVPLPTGSQINQANSESTLDDYNNIPINDFGMAMLRGMGWSESSGIGKNNQQAVATVEPELRPKGMGLGANKMINAKKNLVKVNEEQDGDLQLVRGGCAKIIAGSNKGKYCEVMSWDDESGRIIVKTTIEQNILSLNEFLVIPVSKEEYQKNGRILNNAKYEEYKDDNNTDQNVKSKLEKDKNEASSSKSTDRSSRKRRHSTGSSNDESSQRKQRVERRSPEQRPHSKYDSSSSNYDDRSREDKKSRDHHKRKKHKHKEGKRHKNKRRSRDREHTEKKKKKRRRSSSREGSHNGNGYSSDEHIRKSKSKKKYR
ncbi:g patch and kow-containing [Holotrichia oblita]|uniref:G patch and kow-containing n=1 Tax=Holotrichia oblita TaxID=644536 RepID=A0ACB9T0R6_HOLOL|nr:g patch and kow-containing [Holotrichia oblita]